MSDNHTTKPETYKPATRGRTALKTGKYSEQHHIHGYKMTGRWQLNAEGWASVTLSAASILLFGFSFFLGIFFHGLLTGTQELSFSISAADIAFFPLLLAVIIVTIVLHEAVHGLMFTIMGNKPRFGFRMIGRFFPVVYATSSVPLPRNRYLLIALSPFLVITAICFGVSIIIAPMEIVLLALLAMALNISGSIGDLICSRNILRYDRDTMFEDIQDGFILYSRLMPGQPG
jgi:hypothetical protein